MNIKEKLPVIGVVAGIIILLYVFIAVRPLATELHFNPEWSKSIFQATQQADSQTQQIPFNLGSWYGYFTPEGSIISCSKTPYKVTISEDYFAEYNQDSKQIFCKNRDSSPAGTIDASGFPAFCENRLFLFTPGGNGVMQFNADGSRRWSWEGYCPITTFSSSDAYTLIGTADGTIYTLNSEGIIDQEFVPGGSDSSVILGAALSPDGMSIATVSGLNKQRFVLTSKINGITKPVFHEYLPGDLYRQTKVAFSKDGSTVFYNYKGGLGIVNVQTLKHAHIPLEGTILSIEESNGMICILSQKASTRYAVSIIEPFSSLLGSFSYTADSTFIATKDNALYVGKDDTISRINLSRN